MSERWWILVTSWSEALVFVSIAVVTGWGLGKLALRQRGPDRVGWATRAQYLAVALLLWATFGDPGWQIQSISGGTAVETVNTVLHHSLHFSGAMLLAFSAAWTKASVWS